MARERRRSETRRWSVRTSTRPGPGSFTIRRLRWCIFLAERQPGNQTAASMSVYLRLLARASTPMKTATAVLRVRSPHPRTQPGRLIMLTDLLTTDVDGLGCHWTSPPLETPASRTAGQPRTGLDDRNPATDLTTAGEAAGLTTPTDNSRSMHRPTRPHVDNHHGLALPELSCRPR
jgi:hypothetical protein